MSAAENSPITPANPLFVPSPLPFGLPPFAALAVLTGAASGELADALREQPGISVGGSDGEHAVRAATWDELGDALASVPRPKGVRIEVDPARR